MKTIFQLLACGTLLSCDCAAIFQGESIDDGNLTEILQGGVNDKTYPGAVAMVGNQHGILYQKAVGRFTYSEDSPSVQVTKSALEPISLILDLAGLSVRHRITNKSSLNHDFCSFALSRRLYQPRYSRC
jgi:hypothetical protein